MAIKAITFDFWSTLYQPQKIDYRQRQQRLKETLEQHSHQAFELERFQAAVRVARDAWNQAWVADYRTMGAEEWLGIILAELNTSLAPDSLTEIQTGLEQSVLNELPTLAPEAQTTLAALSSHYRLAIISDTGLIPGQVLRQILAQDNLLDYFLHLTFSDELGHSKPHPNAFLSTLKGLGAAPQQAVHVGDLLRTDIAGAQRVGMRGVQYVGLNHDEASDSGEAAPKPDAVIKTHRELGTLLQKWDNVTR